MAAQNYALEEHVRFSLFQRVCHFLVMIGFIGLAITGLGLAFSAYSLPKAAVWLMGGQANAAFLHRLFALLTILMVFIHALWFLYYKFVLGKKFSSHETIIFQRYDLTTFGQNIMYFLGKRAHPPDFYRYTYFQKLSYWALFLGMISMGITGLLLMYPEFFTGFLPGYFINIAQILHFWEAILAITLKLIFHSLLEHLRPNIFPMDKSIFTGQKPPSVLRHEHSAEWEMLYGQKD